MLTSAVEPFIPQCKGLLVYFGILGLRASLEQMPNVPESEGKVRVGIILFLFVF